MAEGMSNGSKQIWSVLDDEILSYIELLKRTRKTNFDQRPADMGWCKGTQFINASGEALRAKMRPWMYICQCHWWWLFGTQKRKNTSEEARHPRTLSHPLLSGRYPNVLGPVPVTQSTSVMKTWGFSRQERTTQALPLPRVQALTSLSYKSSALDLWVFLSLNY